VVVEEDRVLLVREGRGRKRGRWNLPGGRVVEGERLIAAAVRETKEETGYHIKCESLVGVYINTHHRTRPSVRLHLLARVVDGDIAIDGDEIVDARWFALEQVADLPDRKLWVPSLLRQTLAQVSAEAGCPLRVLREVDAYMSVA
jgi:8-oxo-dGTP diphosphatase